MFNYRYDAASGKKQAKFILFIPFVVTIAIERKCLRTSPYAPIIKKELISLIQRHAFNFVDIERSLANFDLVARKECLCNNLVVYLRNFHAKKKRSKRAKLIMYFLCALFYSFAALREIKSLSKRH